jgi:hypothetical protein
MEGPSSAADSGTSDEQLENCILTSCVVAAHGLDSEAGDGLDSQPTELLVAQATKGDRQRHGWLRIGTMVGTLALATAAVFGLYHAAAGGLTVQNRQFLQLHIDNAANRQLVQPPQSVRPQPVVLPPPVVHPWKVVSNTPINVRQKPSFHAHTIGTKPHGAVIMGSKVSDASGDWVRLEHESKYVNIAIGSDVLLEPTVTCLSWCGDKRNPWDRCCSWDKCGGCSQCATTTTLAMDSDSPTLFCWLVMRTSTTEAVLVRKQYISHVGVFACDEHTVFSDTRADIGDGHMSVEIGSLESKEMGNQWHSMLNTRGFLKAWDKLLEAEIYNRHDWTVKADADSVFLPHRLKVHAQNYPHGDTIWIKNSIGNTKLLGSLEVFSRLAVQVFKQKRGQCEDMVDSSGEDGFMASCMQHLGVKQHKDLALVLNNNFSANCRHPYSVSFHPFKNPDAWFACLQITKGHLYN